MSGESILSSKYWGLSPQPIRTRDREHVTGMDQSGDSVTSQNLFLEMTSWQGCCMRNARVKGQSRRHMIYNQQKNLMVKKIQEIQ